MEENDDEENDDEEDEANNDELLLFVMHSSFIIFPNFDCCHFLLNFPDIVI